MDNNKIKNKNTILDAYCCAKTINPLHTCITFTVYR